MDVTAIALELPERLLPGGFARSQVAPAGSTGAADLLRRAQAGDDRAFEALYRTHVGRVFALALRLTADREDATELVQDTFVRAWEALPRFRGDSALGTWLHRITVNLVLEGRRASGRRARRIFFSDDPAALERPPAAPSPAERVDLERAIASLPAGARMVFVLHDVEGYEHQEISRMAGIAVGTSKAQLFRARRLLREVLDR